MRLKFTYTVLTHPFPNSEKTHHISIKKAMRLIVPKEKNKANLFSPKETSLRGQNTKL